MPSGYLSRRSPGGRESHERQLYGNRRQSFDTWTYTSVLTPDFFAIQSHYNQVLSLIETILVMLLNNVTPQTPISMPSTATWAPNYSRPHPQLRVFTGARSPLYHPTPRLHSQLEVVRTAPLLLNPPPPRRAVSENVNALIHSTGDAAPTPPPRTRPGLGHKRKISEKLKSIFLPRQTSAPVLDDPLPLATAPVNYPPRVSSMHYRNESVPETRVAKWVQEQSISSTQSPPRPRRSPDTASFVVSSLATDFTFPRYQSHPHAESTPALHADTKEMCSPLDEDTLLEPITAALYPNGRGLLGATQQRARFDNDTEGGPPSMFRFDDPRPPVYSLEREIKCDVGTSEVSEDHFSDFAQWYVAPK